MQGTYMGATYKAIYCMVHMFGVKQLLLKISSQKWVAICMHMCDEIFTKFIARPSALP